MHLSSAFRQAVPDDVPAIVDFGNSIPELKVNAEIDFMTQNEVLSAVMNPRGIFLVAVSEGSIVGFSYANTQDLDRVLVAGYACLVYLAVRNDRRTAGLGNALYQRTLDELKSRGVSYVYAWANPTSGIIEFMQRRGWSKGKPCVWMDISL